MPSQCLTVKFLPVGGKTGTGDNRYKIAHEPGRSRRGWLDNRTATFVFVIGERFFGTVSVYVSGGQTNKYQFTSALPVQLLKLLAPKLMPLIVKAHDSDI